MTSTTFIIDGQALLMHTLARIEDDVSFLRDHNLVSPEAHRQIIALLPQRAGQGLQIQMPMAPTMPMPSAPVLAPTPTPPPAPNPIMSALKRVVPPPPKPKPSVPQNLARALWDYNVDGKDGDDLSFREGDIIHITSEEEGEGWWKGKVGPNGKEGLFPSNYVERTTEPAAPPYRQIPPAPTYGYSEKQPYDPLAQPPVASGSNAPGPSDPTTTQGEEPKKKNKFGKLGSTMGNAAAGGVGFGAGAAIGSGIIHAIF
jgi:hypothetical protein